ncbi:hypothetical protein HPB50_012783 [Hyalomma asiaticum]|uniref:Uncharacterized protein n=1 Tax=Hyalomma asiaticum TaxID=266040 RepID=A0ACB7SEP6_HYAAI|nr:hypothetical protein HPB50_012783 [Hyalomma asiaticum]
MTELWSSVNGSDGDASGLEEFLHADDAVATNGDLTDEAIVAAVTGAEDDSSDDEEELEPMQVVSHQEALQMIDSLRDFVFAKNLPLGHAQQLDALQKDINKMAKWLGHTIHENYYCQALCGDSAEGDAVNVTVQTNSETTAAHSAGQHDSRCEHCKAHNKHPDVPHLLTPTRKCSPHPSTRADPG